MSTSFASLRSITLAAGFAVGAMALPAASRAQDAKLDDPTIVAIFDAANTWDIESSGLGAQTSHNKDVVALAKMFVHDHTSLRQQGRDLAKKLGVTPTPPKDFPLAKVHADAMTKLRSDNAASFDRDFLQNEVDYHKAVIDAVNTSLLPAIQNAELKAFVVKVAPAFQAHMIAAQNLLNSLPK